MIFEKYSTRTRLSLQLLFNLGGDRVDVKFDEPILVEVRVLKILKTMNCYLDGLFIELQNMITNKCIKAFYKPI